MFGENVENKPLAIYSMIFHSYEELDSRLSSLEDFWLKLSAGKTDLKEEASDRRGRLSLAYVKVVYAVKGLNVVLRRPPTYNEVSEVIGVKRHTVERILRREYSTIPPVFPYGIRFISHTDLGMRVEKNASKSEVKRLMPKRKGFGKPIKWRKDDSGGRPYKLIAATNDFDPLLTMYSGLGEAEKLRLESYLSSPPLVDLAKQVLIKFISLLFNMSRKPEVAEELAERLLKPINERIIALAERHDVTVTQELREYLSLNWLPDALKASEKIDLDEICKSIETMPDDEFAQRFLIAPFKEG